MPKKTVVYDSNDPNLPNLPQSLLETNESDAFSEDENEADSSSNSIDDQPRGVSNSSQMPPSRVATEGSLTFDTSNAAKKKRRRKNRRRNKQGNRRYSNTTQSSSQARQRISWEPGIDINSTQVILASLGSSVTVTDYNEKRYRVERMDIETNMRVDADCEDDSDDDNECGEEKMIRKDLIEELKEKTQNGIDKLENVLNSRPGWSKIRWINVNGLSWETIVTLANHFNLHKLAVEDMIDIPTRTKIDFYPDCLFGVIAMAKLVKETKVDRFKEEPPSSWVESLQERKKEKMEDGINFDWKKSMRHDNMSINERYSKFHRIRRLNDSFKPPVGPTGSISKRSARSTNYLNNQKPLSYRNLFVGIEQCSFFLLKNGTVLTFFESSGDEIENAILSRISKSETILMKSCDPSILLQNILDSIVDIIYPILAAYRKRLDEFEIESLMAPNLSHTRALHLLYGELESLRKSILPVTSLISSIRELSQQNMSAIEMNGASNGQTASGQVYKSGMRFISPVSDLYYADIVDHTLMFTSEIEGMINSTENLIDLIFNTISTDTNNSMRQLSLITVIFLPLSFWTGYYGMNFQSFGDLQYNVSYYWKIAIPFSFGLVTLLTWSVSRSYFKAAQKFFLDVFFVIQSRLRRLYNTERPLQSKRIKNPETV